MTRTLIACLLVLGCAAVAFAAPPDDAKGNDPKSNNKDKIVGKWKITGGGDMKADELKQMEAFGVAAFMEFDKDGACKLGVVAKDPEIQKLIDAGKEKTGFAFKYKIGAGDEVEFFDLPKELKGPFGKKDKAKVQVKIDGDSMTMTEEDSLKKPPLKLTKLK